MSNLIFRALLSDLRWEDIIRVLGLSERVKGIGDGNIDGYRYTIVQRGDGILIVLPDYEPREKCAKDTSENIKYCLGRKSIINKLKQP